MCSSSILGRRAACSSTELSSGKPVTYMANVKLNGIEVVDRQDEFKSVKLNLFLESSAGTIVMLTAGLQTIWSQCIVTALMGLVDSGNLDSDIQA